jgi:hypothetical protein
MGIKPGFAHRPDCAIPKIPSISGRSFSSAATESWVREFSLMKKEWPLMKGILGIKPKESKAIPGLKGMLGWVG